MGSSLKTNNRRHSPGILFVGDSFTWGQGLWFYSGLDTLVMPEDNGAFDRMNVTAAQRKFMQAYRFPRLVANYFDTFEFVQEKNGGSNIHNVDGWDRTIFGGGLLSGQDVEPEETDPDWSLRTSITAPNNIHPSEIGLCIFQLTYATRDPIYVSDEEGFCNIDTYMKLPQFEVFCKMTKMSIDDFLKSRQKASLLNVKRFIMKLEEHGIPTLIITYPPEVIPLILADSYLRERFSSLPMLDGTHINDLRSNALEKIANDTDTFGDNPPEDHHMSMKSHRVVADILIREILRRDLWKHTKIYY